MHLWFPHYTHNFFYYPYYLNETKHEVCRLLYVLWSKYWVSLKRLSKEFIVKSLRQIGRFVMIFSKKVDNFLPTMLIEIWTNCQAGFCQFKTKRIPFFTQTQQKKNGFGNSGHSVRINMSCLHQVQVKLWNNFNGKKNIKYLYKKIW